MLKKRIGTVLLALVLCLSLFSYSTAYAGNYHLRFKSVTMYTGESCSVSLVNSKGKAVSKKCRWSSNNKKAFSKGTFNEKSSAIFITPHKKGTFKIYCTCAGKKYTCKVKVKSFLKKGDKKVKYSYTNSNGDVIQLIRVKNSSSSVKEISTYLYKYDLYTPWNAIPKGKYAYLKINKTQKEAIDISRPNVNIKGMNNIAMTKNRTSKTDCSIKVNDDNTYTVKVKNRSSDYISVSCSCVLFNENKKVVYITSDSTISANPKESKSITYPLPDGEGIGAVSGKIYYNAASY